MSTVGHRHLGGIPARSSACAELMARIADGLEARGDVITVELIDLIAGQLDEFRERPELAEEFLDAGRDCLTLINAMARSWSDPHAFPPPEAAVVWARSLVHRDIRLHALLRVYRLGQAGYQEVWHDELRASGAAPELVLEASRAISAFSFIWIDAILQPLIEAYEDERDRRMRGAGAARLEALRAILDGSLADETLASTRLSYELRRSHQAFVLWTEPASGALEQTWIDRVTEAVERVDGPGSGTGHPFIVRTSPWSVVGCVSASSGVELPLSGILSFLHETPTRAAFGRRRAGLEGFRRSAAEAERARRVVRLVGRRDAVTSFADVEVIDLLTRDPAAARAFATETLGGLAAADPSTRRLLETLRCFYEEGQSFARTARRLDLHENSISYRVHRAAELAGGVDVSSWALRAAVELTPLIDAK